MDKLVAIMQNRRSQRRKLLAMAARIGSVITLVVVLSSCGGGTEGTTGTGGAGANVQSSGGPLDSITKQANQLLGGGEKAFKQRLESLRGYPVVVNKWASWCGPCRVEFPYFQKLSKQLEGKVAFLGVNTTDDRSEAEQFLKDLPVNFPSYEDPDQAIATLIEASQPFPATVFYSKSGELVQVHPGQYASLKDLKDDVERYVLSPKTHRL